MSIIFIKTRKLIYYFRLFFLTKLYLSACLGLRFGMMQTRLCLVKILMNFDLSVSDRTVIPMKFDPKVLLLNPVGGSWIKIKKRKTSDS